MTSKRLNFHELPRFIELDHASREAAVEYANDVLRSEYWNACRSIANEYLDEAAHDGAEIDREEWVSSSVDNTEWTIYTHRLLQVMRYTENDGAAEEAGCGMGEGADSLEAYYRQLAFYAMCADVQAHISALQK